MFRKILILSVVIFLFSVAVYAQSETGAETESASVSEESFQELPPGYSGIQLGMDIDTVKDRLLEDPNFSYRGDPDVSMLPQDKQQVIDCDGSFYIDRAWFQFEDRKLSLIIIMMDREHIDHYSLYTAFSEKYGPPSEFSPAKAVWENESVVISIERPLSVKYMDKEVLDRLQADSEAEKAVEAVLRDDFLNSF